MSAGAEFGVMIFANDAAVAGVTRVPAGGRAAADVMVIPAPHDLVGRMKLPVNVPESTSESPGCEASSAPWRLLVTCTVRVAFAKDGDGMARGNSANVATVPPGGGDGGGGGGGVVTAPCTVIANEPTTPSIEALIIA